MKFSIEAEQSVIGGLMLDPSRLDDVSDILSSMDFYHIGNRAIFESIQFMNSMAQAIDVITVSEYMQAIGDLEKAGGISYLVEIVNNTPSAHNVRAYARIISDRAIERKITEAGQRIIELGESDGDVDDKLNSLHSELSTLERDEKAEIIDFDKLLKSEVQDIDCRFRGEKKNGLKLGFDALDKRFGGIEKDDLWILAARPAMGKTTLAINIAKNVSDFGKEVLIFSLEMGKEQLTKRLLSAASSIPYGVLRDGNMQEHNWPQLTAGVLKLKGKKIHIVDIASIDVDRAFAIARKFARGGNLGLIIVDYLQLMTTKSATRFDEVSAISRKLKAMAKTTGVPVLALSQLSRSADGEVPKNSHLRESGQIEQDADIITFIHRDEVNNPDSLQKGVAQIHTTKFRNGEIGVDYLATKLQFSRFEDMEHDYIVSVPEKQSNKRGFS